METYDYSLAPRFNAILVRREAELRAILRASNDSAEQAGDEQSHQVLDFKDRASDASLAVGEEVKAEHAAHELVQVLAAQRRLYERSYGYCLDCEEPIDLRRLTALPATPYCAACQTIREHQPGQSMRR